jgi:hypothetical protein
MLSKLTEFDVPLVSMAVGCPEGYFGNGCCNWGYGTSSNLC